jgi:hypothetical protein
MPNKIKILLVNVFVLITLIGLCTISIFFYSKGQINSFFEIKSANHKMFLQKDSLAMFIHLPNIKIHENWGTPQQRVTNKRRTNNLGFRENEDIRDKKDCEIRILVTGDSHTDGSVKENNNTFINVLEHKLNESQTDHFYNCINGGTAFYTFKNYHGFLKKYLYLKPDVYIITVFTGNDFRETILFESDRTTLENVYKYTYNKAIRKFFSTDKKALLSNQGVEQTLYFDYFKEDISTSLKHSKKYLTAIKKICEENNIKLIVTLLPSKIETNAIYKNQIKSAFNLNEDIINTNKNLTTELKEYLTLKNIKYIDLLKPLKESKEKVFWDHDLHINTHAHSIIGDYLYTRLDLR